MVRLPNVSRGMVVNAIFLTAAIGTISLFVPPLAQAANQIGLSGVVAQTCTIGVTADPNASNLNLTDSTQHVVIGTILQSCNKKAGYTIVVSSTNCTGTPTGAKVIGGTSSEYLKYTVESVNPTTGGSSADVTNLLNNTCTNQNARAVTNSKITAETSTVYANFTGNPSLSADTYTDTLTFTINVN